MTVPYEWCVAFEHHEEEVPDRVQETYVYPLVPKRSGTSALRKMISNSRSTLGLWKVRERVRRQK